MKNNKQIRRKGGQMMGRPAEQWEEQLWEKLVNKITNAKSPKETNRLLENLISKYEKKMILRRLAVTALVRSGKTYQEIGEILWMSPQTISTTKKNILGNVRNYKSYKHFYGGPRIYSPVDKSRNRKSLLEEVFGSVDFLDLLTNPPRPSGMGIKQK